MVAHPIGSRLCGVTTGTVREQTPWVWGPAGVGILMALLFAAGVLNSLGQIIGQSAGVAALGFVGVAAVVVLAIWLYRRVIMGTIGRRDTPELPARPAWRPLLLGVAGGVAFMGVSAAIVAAAGGYRFSAGAGLGVAEWLQLAGLVLASGVLEELTFRGVGCRRSRRASAGCPRC